MSTIGRWLAGIYARAALASVAGVVAMVLVVDFADRAYSFQGPGWAYAVARLYANLAAELAYQVSPAALLLAAGIAVSALRQQGEYTALLSVGVSPGRIIATMLGACTVACCAIMALNEWVVVDASRRAEEIKAERFRRAGDFQAYFGQRRWFRGKEAKGAPPRIFHVTGEDGDALAGVTIFELGEGFTLARRIDVERMKASPDGGWLLERARIDTFRGGERVGAESHATLRLELPETAEDFRVRSGRPKQLRLGELWEQIDVRRRLGLPEAEYRLELHGRMAYPLAAVPGALLAVRLALRRNRRGHLTAALAEGILVSLLVWTLLVVFRAIGLAGTLPPAVAAWAPPAIVGVVGALVGAIQELLWRRPVPVRPPA